MDDMTTLEGALAFHGHKCWASTAGVRLGLAAMRALDAERAGSKQLHAIIETGDHHGGMGCGDGIQFRTGCTCGKGNIEKSGEGKFAVTLVDKAAGRAVRGAYKPPLQPRIRATPFIQKGAAGVPPRAARPSRPPGPAARPAAPAARAKTTPGAKPLRIHPRTTPIGPGRSGPGAAPRPACPAATGWRAKPAFGRLRPRRVARRSNASRSRPPSKARRRGRADGPEVDRARGSPNPVARWARRAP